MKKNLPLILILVCAAGFAFGLLQLFKLRFEVGDIYPEYSSLRSDPLGTMALYESLEMVPGFSVRRDHTSANKLPDGRDTTYLHLAAKTKDWLWLPEEIWKEIDAFVLNGGRLAITFFPETGSGPGFSRTPATTSPSAKKKKSGAGARPHEMDTLVERWGVEFEFEKLPQQGRFTRGPVSVTNRTELDLPESLAWHSATVFTNVDEAWRTIYARGTNPVVIERRFGKGSVVMATDSYFVSNEAMRKDRQPEFLAWFLGDNAKFVFDEAHLGIVEQPGVATLIRNYRLQGLALALLILAGLFIWKNSLSLVPPAVELTVQNEIAGKDAASGFVNLLRRNIPSREIINVCFDEWTKTMIQGRHYTLAGVDQAQAVIQAESARGQRARDPVTAYRTIAKVLKSPAQALPNSSNPSSAPANQESTE